MTKILIASPTYDGSVRKEYMKSILQMTDYFRSAGIGWELLLEPATVLHTMRSVMASKALDDIDTTHLLFVDTDMGFSVSAIKKMIEADTAVIGCAYPYRTIPLHETPELQGENLRKTISASVPYALTFPEGTKKVDVVKGLCEVKRIGTGLMLITTAALGVMRDKARLGVFRNGFPYNQFYKGEKYLGFFDHLKIDGAYIGEDYSFCDRWTEKCGGKIFAVVDEEILHIGNLPVAGRYLDKLKTGKL